MKQATLYILILLSCLLAACTADDLPEGNAPATDGGGRLRITYRVASSDVQTKIELPKTETEAGNVALNENKVTRLDLFVDKGSSFIHIPPKNLSVEDASTIQTLDLTDEELEQIGKLTEGTTLYLVANCEGCDNITTLAALQALTTGGTFNFRGKQETFVMDGSYAIAPRDLETKNITIRIDLKRALSKIRFSFSSKSDDNFTLNSYRFFNYASSTSVLAGQESYNNSPQSMSDYESFTGEPALLTDTDGRYIFYSYPNDWFNQSEPDSIKVEDEEERQDYISHGYQINKDNLLTNADGEILYQFDSDGLHNGEPIAPARQTYLMLQATYKDEPGYYRIPVSHHLPKESDQPYFTRADIDAIHDYYYRLKRNHLYDVSVSIDGPGGTLEDPVVPSYTITINDWIHDGEYHLSPGEFN